MQSKEQIKKDIDSLTKSISGFDDGEALLAILNDVKNRYSYIEWIASIKDTDFEDFMQTFINDSYIEDTWISKKKVKKTMNDLIDELKNQLQLIEADEQEKYQKEIKPVYPNSKFKSFCYIKSVITRPNIIVGDYSYYDDSEEGPESFEKHVTHHYNFMGDKLIIGKFVAIARGVEFIMNGANHMLDCLTTYPFEIIDEFKGLSRPFGDRRNRGDTVVGNDVWIGQNSTILPGVHIGDGAVIGANTLVSKDVPPYAVVVGNPAIIKKYRFDKETIELLLKLKWWDKDIKEIKKLIPFLTNDLNISKKELKKLIKDNNI